MSIASGTIITAANRGEWLEERQRGIGASEAATVLGINPYETRLELFLKKLGQSGPTPESQAMRWGTLLEPLIAEEYSRVTGFSFTAEQLFVRSPTHEFMTATLDRVRDDGRIVELKTVGARSAHLWGDEGSDEVPAPYLAQVSHQMVVTGTDVADVAVLIAGQDFRLYSVWRDDDIAARIVDANAKFWASVLRRDPPPPDYGRDIKAMAALYPRAEGAMELDPVGLALVETWEALGAEIRDRQLARDRARCELLSILGERATAKLADGRVLSRRVVDVAERTVTQRGYSYSDLRILRGA